MHPVAHPRPLGWKAECAQTLQIAGPLALANVLQMLTYAVDVIFIARLGTAELAASSLVISILGTLVWSLHGLGGAVAPVIAAELGARAPALRAVRRSVRMALWLAVISGLVVMGLLSQGPALMRLTGQDPALIELAQRYNMVLLWCVVPMVMASVLRNFVSALGRPVLATIITGLSVLVNATGNYMLVFGNWGAPAMGLEGAALATIISALFVLAAYIVAIRLDPRLARYRVFGRFWRPDWQRLWQLLRIGLPISATILAEASVFGAAAFLMGRIGADELAAHTLALNIASFAFQVPQGVAQATAIRVGYYFGAREPVGLARAGWAGIVMGTAFMLLTALAMLLAPQHLLALYIDPWDPANAGLVAMASTYLMVGAAFQLFDGMQVVGAGALRGLQDTRVPMWFALFAYWVPGFGLAVGLGFFTALKGLGVWIGLAVGLVFASALLLSRWHRRERLGLVPR
ncbi:MATE family efflux transporter [Alteraurantiacibacter buctensis]|uniref:Multidrug-efflux transporter n=1 Tax=Alteraurantiacibacter buctensis TaxID=1503981 RepID=A0A844YV01_9SPHN|nr:MATE family efflux transporter [Alteraurantiacibacter buctensis]MXO70314.1 MATE family efflux transporter [Alteraurantiacibacter buctensis]